MASSRCIPAALAVLVVTGCGTPTGVDDGPKTAKPTDQNALYDPCQAIGDELATIAGYDPATRSPDRIEFSGTALACTFRSERRVLLVESTDGSFDAYRSVENDRAADVDPVNGRQSFTFRDPADKYSCFAVMRTNAGFVAIVSTVQSAYAYLEEPCDGIVELATLIEPTIGEGN